MSYKISGLEQAYRGNVVSFTQDLAAMEADYELLRETLKDQNSYTSDVRLNPILLPRLVGVRRYHLEAQGFPDSVMAILPSHRFPFVNLKRRVRPAVSDKSDPFIKRALSSEHQAPAPPPEVINSWESFTSTYSIEELLQKEEWRYCPGMSVDYQVSNYGRVRSIALSGENKSLRTLLVPVGDMSAADTLWKRAYCSKHNVVPLVDWQEITEYDYSWVVKNLAVAGRSPYMTADVKWQQSLSAERYGVKAGRLFGGRDSKNWRLGRESPHLNYVRERAALITLITFDPEHNKDYNDHTLFKKESEEALLQYDRTKELPDVPPVRTKWTVVHLNQEQWDCRASNLRWVPKFKLEDFKTIYRHYLGLEYSGTLPVQKYKTKRLLEFKLNYGDKVSDTAIADRVGISIHSVRAIRREVEGLTQLSAEERAAHFKDRREKDHKNRIAAGTLKFILDSAIQTSTIAQRISETSKFQSVVEGQELRGSAAARDLLMAQLRSYGCSYQEISLYLELQYGIALLPNAVGKVIRKVNTADSEDGILGSVVIEVRDNLLVPEDNIAADSGAFVEDDEWGVPDPE